MTVNTTDAMAGTRVATQVGGEISFGQEIHQR